MHCNGLCLLSHYLLYVPVTLFLSFKVLIPFIYMQGCLFIPLGRLADVHGRKRAFLLGAIWTGAFSLGCGFSQNIITLDVLRGLQGIGPAAMVPASVCQSISFIPSVFHFGFF